MNLLDVQDKLLVTGGTGMVGVALQKVLPHATYVGSKYDLTNFDRTMELFEEVKPEYVVSQSRSIVHIHVLCVVCSKGVHIAFHTADLCCEMNNILRLNFIM